MHSKTQSIKCNCKYRNSIYILQLLYSGRICYSLMCGDSIDEALDFATDIWGESDIEWADMYLTDNEIKPEVATPKLQ